MVMYEVENGAGVSTISIVLPENIISSAYFLGRGVGAVFVSTHRIKNTTRKVRLHKNSDSSVKIQVTVYKTPENDLPTPDNILIENVCKNEITQPISCENFTQLVTGCWPMKHQMSFTRPVAEVTKRDAQVQVNIVNNGVHRNTCGAQHVDHQLDLNVKSAMQFVPSNATGIVGNATIISSEPGIASGVPDQRTTREVVTDAGETESRNAKLSQSVCIEGSVPNDITSKPTCSMIQHGTQNQFKIPLLRLTDTTAHLITHDNEKSLLLGTFQAENDSPNAAAADSSLSTPCRKNDDAHDLRGNSDNLSNKVEIDVLEETVSCQTSMEMTTESEPYCCAFCKAPVKDKKSMLAHIHVNHANDPGVSDYIEQVRSSTRIPCDTCGKMYSGHVQLAVHTRLMHVEHARAKCTRCGVTVKSTAHLRLHERRVHGDTSNLHLCHLCPAQMKQRAHLAAHIKRVHGKSSHRCEHCGQTWRCAYYLNRHVKLVHTAPRYACQHCARPFTTDANRKRHEKLTHGPNRDKAHECTICHKWFTLPSNLRHHHRTLHLQQFRFKCPVCDSGFSRRKELAQHQQLAHQNSTALVASSLHVDTANNQKETVPTIASGNITNVINSGVQKAPLAGASANTTYLIKTGGNGQFIVATPEMLKIFNTIKKS